MLGLALCSWRLNFLAIFLRIKQKVQEKRKERKIIMWWGWLFRRLINLQIRIKNGVVNLCVAIQGGLTWRKRSFNYRVKWGISLVNPMDVEYPHDWKVEWYFKLWISNPKEKWSRSKSEEHVYISGCGCSTGWFSSWLLIRI